MLMEGDEDLSWAQNACHLPFLSAGARTSRRHEEARGRRELGENVSSTPFYASLDRRRLL